MLVCQPTFSKNTPSTAKIDPSRLKEHVLELSRQNSPRDYSNIENLDRCAEYISSHFKRAGAVTSLQEFTVRKKKYKNVFQYTLTLGVSVNKDKRLDKLRSDLEKKYRDLNTKIDYTAKVKPIRVDTDKFFEWMESDNIYDSQSGNIKNLHDVNRAYFEMLTKLQVLFYIYVGSGFASDNKYKTRIEDLKAEANESLRRIQRIS